MHNLVGASLIILRTSYSVRRTKALKAEGARLGALLKIPEVEDASLILLSYLEKKKTNMSARLLSEP